MKQRRQFSPEYKTRLVLEMVSGKRSPAEIARAEQLSAGLLATWKREFLEHASDIFRGEERRDEQARKIAELEGLIGRLTIENDLLKKASRWLSSTARKSA